MSATKKDYDSEPVCYCKRCLSLRIVAIPLVPGQFCCDECGTSELAEATDIEEWKKLYRERYGHDFIIKKERKWPYWCQKKILN